MSLRPSIWLWAAIGDMLLMDGHRPIIPGTRGGMILGTQAGMILGTGTIAGIRPTIMDTIGDLVFTGVGPTVPGGITDLAGGTDMITGLTRVDGTPVFAPIMMAILVPAQFVLRAIGTQDTAQVSLQTATPAAALGLAPHAIALPQVELAAAVRPALGLVQAAAAVDMLPVAVLAT